MKKALFLVAFGLVGCATQPQTFDRSDMVGFKPDCGQARTQVDYLQQRINEYHAYFQSRPITEQDRRYYTRLKNNIWSLRASCSVLQR